MVDFTRALMAATSGALTGFAEAAEKEDEKRNEITKIALAQRIKNIEAARELQKKKTEARREQDQFVDTFAGKFAFFNEDTNKLEPLSEAQALEIYTLSDGDKSEAVKLIQNNEIRFKGQGKVQDLAPITTLDPLDDTLAALEDSQAGGLFGKGRYESITREVQKQIKLIGGDKAVKAPQLRAAVGTGLQIAADKDFKIHMAGRFTFEDAQGKPVTREGVITTDGSRMMVGDTPEEYVPAPSTASFTKYTTRTETPTPRDKVYFDIRKELNTKEFVTAQEQVRGAQIGLDNLSQTYEQMAPYALDRTTYSITAKSIGSLIKQGQAEIAGIRFVFTGDEAQQERDSTSTIAELDAFINENLTATEPQMRAEVLATMQIRAAYSFLQANGDTRPSDADLKRAMQQFDAGSPEAFLITARENWIEATKKAEGLYNNYLTAPSFTQARRFANAEQFENAYAYENWLEDNTLKTPTADLPSFLALDPENPDKIIVNPELIKKAQESKEKAGGGQQVTLVSPDGRESNVFFVDGKYYRQVDKEGNPVGTGFTAGQLKDLNIQIKTK